MAGSICSATCRWFMFGQACLTVRQWLLCTAGVTILVAFGIWKAVRRSRSRR